MLILFLLILFAIVGLVIITAIGSGLFTIMVVLIELLVIIWIIGLIIKAITKIFKKS